MRKADFPAYKDGKQALYVAKLMLLKMAHKDWTPIDRQWITSQAKRLRAALPAAVHFGCEGTLAGQNVQAPERLGPADTGDNVAERQAFEFEFEFDVCAGVYEGAISTLLAATPPGAAGSALSSLERVDAAAPAAGDGDDEGSVAASSDGDGAGDEAAAVDDGDGAQLIKLRVRVVLDDHSRRLGTLREAPPRGEAAGSEGAAAVLELDKECVSNDVRELRSWLAQLIGLHNVARDPDEFRCAHPLLLLRTRLSSLVLARVRACLCDIVTDMVAACVCTDEGCRFHDRTPFRSAII